MQTVYDVNSKNNNFFKGHNPFDLIEKFGSVLYVYNEEILRKNMRKLKNFVSYDNFKVYYSAKANSNIAILQIAKQEGLFVDAMSSGEIFAQEKAGFLPEDIFYCCNNVSASEMKFAIDRGVLVGVDSLSQLEMFGKLNKNGKVAIRFNGGLGTGHHEKVVTAGKNTKFGVNAEYIDDCKNIIEKYNLKLVGIHQHIGSLFLDTDSYVSGVKNLLEIAKEFSDLEFVDCGGGFGVPYERSIGTSELDLTELGQKLDKVFNDFVKSYGKKISFHIEPGRLIPCEAGVLLGTVHSKKNNAQKIYIGTDLGFNVLLRPTLYDSYHEVEIYRNTDVKSTQNEVVSIVGNICESGDIIAKDRELPQIFEGDIIAVLDAGAYGFVMSSNYNNRLRPCEILIRESGEICVIRERDTLEDLVKNQHLIK